ncbi:extracellular solute-binding protein [Herbaspirillum camelliae]|uniref:extracellular solute-binding protein n=1 Tax=Herbaspirillum camelliae TaxID=1892903 RepID=UPI00094A1467|nr:extracellular solute-binding protein [Herbaspirillum camelliae]
MKLSTSCVAFGAFILGNLVLAPAHAEETVVVAATGGMYEQSLRSSFFDEFTKETGIKVRVVTASAQEQITKLKAMNQVGAVTWDIAVLGDIEAHSNDVRAMTEDVSVFCKAFSGRKDLLPGACDAAGVKVNSGLTYIVWNGDKLPDGGPSTWRDVWDVKRFPGGRTFPNFNDPWRILAAALVADGVAPTKLFPLDVDRALRKLDALRPHITLWWKSGDASQQGYRTGEYVMGMVWQTRATPLIREGRNLKFSLKEGVLVSDRATLVKGAPNHANAMKLLGYIENATDGMARHCTNLGCTPPSTAAMEKMSPADQANMPIKPDIYASLIVPDFDWINANRAMMLERWNAWLQK